MTGMHLAGRPMLVPAPVLAEVGYLLGREAGARVEAGFLQSLADGHFQPVDLTIPDYARMSELVNQYADLGLGTTDAAVIALAERLRSSRSRPSTGDTSPSSAPGMSTH
jgi:uncharacterized protein